MNDKSGKKSHNETCDFCQNPRAYHNTKTGLDVCVDHYKKIVGPEPRNDISEGREDYFDEETWSKMMTDRQVKLMEWNSI